MCCRVTRLTTPRTVDGNWEEAPWQAITPLLIGRYVGEEPSHYPKAHVKIAYDDAAVYVIFCVEDRYVRAVVAEHDDKVWRDSCVEFFFTPGRDVVRGYFNLEMNCGGTMLLHFQEASWSVEFLQPTRRRTEPRMMVMAKTKTRRYCDDFAELPTETCRRCLELRQRVEAIGTQVSSSRSTRNRVISFHRYHSQILASGLKADFDTQFHTGLP